MRLKDEVRPVLGLDCCQRLDAERRGVRSVEGIGQRLLELRDLGGLGMLGKRLAVPDEGGQVTPEPARAALVRRIGGDIGLDQLGEGLIAEISVQLLVIVVEDLGEPGDIGVAIDAEQHLALFLVAVVDLVEDGVVAGKDAALEGILKLF